MPKQRTHIRVVREWCQSLGVLTAVSITRQEAEMKLAAYVPLLFDRFPDGAFTTASLEHVARQCVKGFPTYPELAGYLSDWWRAHRPAPPALPAPPPTPRRPDPTPEEIAHVRQCVETIVANMHSPWSEPREAPAPIARHLSPAQLDLVNPLPNGRKRTDGLTANATTGRPASPPAATVDPDAA